MPFQKGNKCATRRKNLDEYYKVDKTGCWNWKLSVTHNGYAHIWWEGKMRRASRVYYERAGKSIPRGYQIDHLCKNVLCVNPEHLEAVSPTENVRRSNVTKLRKEDVECIRTLKFYNQQTLAEIFKVNQSTISRIVNNKRWNYA